MWCRNKNRKKLVNSPQKAKGMSDWGFDSYCYYSTIVWYEGKYLKMLKMEYIHTYTYTFTYTYT